MRAGTSRLEREIDDCLRTIDKLRRVATIATYFMKATECAAQEGSWSASAYWRQLFDALKALGEGE